MSTIQLILLISVLNAGINETVQDIYPLVEYYLKETGQKLVDDSNNPKGDIYRKNQKIDTESGASEL